MLKRAVIIITIFFYNQTTFSQIIYNDTKPFNKLSELKLLIDSAYAIQDRINAGRIDIFEINQSSYLTVDGTFLCYKWQNGQWVNLYKNQHTGYNLHSRKFVYNNQIYSFGGYGYWRYHGQLIWFIEKKGEWEIVPGTENLLNGYSVLDDSILYVLNAQENYSIDLNSKTIKHLNTKIRAKQEKNYDHTPFDLASATTWTPSIIDRKDRKLQYSYQNTFEGIKKAFAQRGLIHIKGDTIDNYTQNYKLIKRDAYLEELELFDEIPLEKLYHPYQKYGYFGIGIIFILAGLIYIRNKVKSNIDSKNPNDVVEVSGKSNPQLPDHPLLEKLINKSSMNQEELDDILEISHIQPDESRKFKRSQLINELNTIHQIKTGKLLIEREKDPVDKRRYTYKINM